MSVSCISLSSSKACPMYSGISISYQSVTEFDQFIQNKMSLELNINCPSFKNEGLRYQTSTACGMYVDILKSNCTPAANIQPMCNNIVGVTIASIQTMANGACNKNSNPILGIIQNYARNNPGNTNCLDASKVEKDLCGFRTREEQKQYCFRNKFVDTCCSLFKPASSILNQSVKADDSTIGLTEEDYHIESANRYLGTALFIYATIGTTISCIIMTSVSIFYVMKRQIHLDKMPHQNAANIADKISTRNSLYF